MASDTPLERATAVYLAEPCLRAFRQDLNILMRRGYVYASPRAFCMARLVDSALPAAAITDAAYPVHGRKDCLHIHLFAGSLMPVLRAWAREIRPAPKFISFERNNELVFYPLVRFLQIAGKRVGDTSSGGCSGVQGGRIDAAASAPSADDSGGQCGLEVHGGSGAAEGEAHDDSDIGARGPGE